MDATRAAMFETGKRYEFRLIQDGGEITFSDHVEAYEHPLLKLRDLEERDAPVMFMPALEPGAQRERVGRLPRRPGRIINVTSPHFISAIERMD